jgi:hypothetical protein
MFSTAERSELPRSGVIQPFTQVGDGAPDVTGRPGALDGEGAGAG